MNTMPTNERKTELKPALSESYQSLFDQYFSQSIYLLGDDLPEQLRKAKHFFSRHFLETTISKRQKTELASTKKRPSNSSDSLNYRGRKKIIHGTNNRDRINGIQSTDIIKGTDSRTNK